MFIKIERIATLQILGLMWKGMMSKLGAFSFPLEIERFNESLTHATFQETTYFPECRFEFKTKMHLSASFHDLFGTFERGSLFAKQKLTCAFSKKSDLAI